MITALPFAAPAHGDSATKPLAATAVGHGGGVFNGTEKVDPELLCDNCNGVGELIVVIVVGDPDTPKAD